MGDRATVETMLGQVQLRRAAPQPHIQRPVWPKGVLRFDFEPELGVTLSACPRVSYVQDRGHAVHGFPLASRDCWHDTGHCQNRCGGGRVELAPERDSNARPTA